MNKIIKILQMPVRNAKGGITQYALRNWEHIDKSRFCFDWVTLDKELSFESDLVSEGCKVYHLSCRQEDNEAIFRSEMEAILKNGYDGVHLHTSYWRGFLAEELAMQAKVPNIIVHAHSSGIDVTDSTERTRLLNMHENWKQKFNIDLATHFTACSNLAADFLFGPQIPRNKIFILRNAVDTVKYTFYPKIREDKRIQMDLNGNFVILHAARMEYQKNHFFSLELFANVLKDIPNAILLLAGTGKLHGELRKKAIEMGIADSISFLGFRNDIPELLQAADLFILPSLFEGLTIAAIEAQCSGIKCLLSSNISKETILSDNAVMLPLDMDTWYDAVMSTVKCGYERFDRATEIAIAGYSIKEQISIIENVYSSKGK